MYSTMEKVKVARAFAVKIHKAPDMKQQNSAWERTEAI